MDCLFCSIQEVSNLSNPEDEIIDESENFYAKAALGHFVFGYSLIISKEHFPSFAYVPEHLFPELESFRDTVLDKLHNFCPHPITIMEHGAISHLLTRQSQSWVTRTTRQCSKARTTH